MLNRLYQISIRNQLFKSFIGMGYHNTHTPTVIERNLLRNPAWYTAYTPYQPEISQGRLEALLNFQTMVSDLTGMELANASVLDEATAAAEAMAMCHRLSKSKSDVFYIADSCHPQTIEVVTNRAKHMGIKCVIGDAFARGRQPRTMRRFVAISLFHRGNSGLFGTGSKRSMTRRGWLRSPPICSA